MVDPVTVSLAVGAASKAFSAIKAGFAAGRDLEQMAGDLTRWMGAVSDVDNAEKQAKNPGVFDKLFGQDSVEATALQAYAAKKKFEEQRYELKVFLNMTHGPGAYDELLAMEGKIRKERQKQVYAQQKLRRQIGDAIAIFIIISIVVGFIATLGAMWLNK